MKFVVQMISFLKNCNFINLIPQIFIFFLILYLWFKIIALESNVFLLEQKLKKDNNINSPTSCSFNKCNIPMPPPPPPHINMNPENFNSFNMDDMIMNEVFNYPHKTPNIKLPVAEHVHIKIEESSDDNNADPEPPIKNEVFDLKKDDNDNISVSSGINKKKLSKLNLDGLKQKCTELNLQTDGTKSELIDRIINADI